MAENQSDHEWGLEWLGCDVISNSLKLLSGQAHASPMLDQIRVPVGTYGMAQQSSAALQDLTAVPCTCKDREESTTSRR